MTNRLSRHIEALLLEHHCVVVPSLGGFVLEDCPARYDAERQLALPPSIALHFNEALVHQDGLLVESYAHVYGISLRRARLVLEEDIRRLRQDLARLRSYQLVGLGILKLSAEGLISFVASPSTLLDSPSYGLAPASLPLINESAEVKIIETDENSRYLHLRIPRRPLRYAVAVAILILTLLPWGQYFSLVDTYESFTASFVPSKQEVSNAISNVESKLNEVAGTTAPPSSASDKPDTHVIEAVKGRHYVVIATERSLERAERYIDEAHKAGLQDVTILKGQSVYRVSGASFDSSTEAYNYIAKLPKAYKEAWVYQSR